MEEVEKGIKSTKEVGEEAGDSCGDMKALRRKDLYLGIGGGERNSSKKWGGTGRNAGGDCKSVVVSGDQRLPELTAEIF